MQEEKGQQLKEEIELTLHRRLTREYACVGVVITEFLMYCHPLFIVMCGYRCCCCFYMLLTNATCKCSRIPDPFSVSGMGLGPSTC